MRERVSTNLAYVAGLIDGEGCIHLEVSQGRWYQPRVSVGMTEPAFDLLTSLHKEWGGTLYQMRKPTAKWAGAWTWHMTGHPAAKLLTAIQPYLRLKNDQAAAALELYRVVMDLPRNPSGTQAIWTEEARTQCEEIRARLKVMNKKGPRVSAQIAEDV